MDAIADIFVVEDDMEVIGYYRFLLDLEGYRIWAIESDGNKAIERFCAARHLPDAILLDHRLPGASGLEVAARLLQRDPNCQIVFLTADDEALEGAREMGLRRLKRKPCEVDRLLRNLRGAVADRRKGQSSLAEEIARDHTTTSSG